jgi:hypothetical protein
VEGGYDAFVGAAVLHTSCVVPLGCMLHFLFAYVIGGVPWRSAGSTMDGPGTPAGQHCSRLCACQAKVLTSPPQHMHATKRSRARDSSSAGVTTASRTICTGSDSKKRPRSGTHMQCSLSMLKRGCGGFNAARLQNQCKACGGLASFLTLGATRHQQQCVEPGRPSRAKCWPRGQPL